MELKKCFDYIGSYLGGILVEKVNSPINGDLYVYYIKGKYLLNTKSTNYSYGELHDGFQKAFRKIEVWKMSVKNCLLLGFGCGSVVSILQEELKMDLHITAIEKDPMILKLGKKYFNTNRFNNLEVVQEDAIPYMERLNMQFDFIVFDIYIDNKIPSAFESGHFIHQLALALKPGGKLLFNKDYNALEMAENIMQLDEHLRNHFKSVEKIQVVPKNIFFLASL